MSGQRGQRTGYWRAGWVVASLIVMVAGQAILLGGASGFAAASAMLGRVLPLAALASYWSGVGALLMLCGLALLLPAFWGPGDGESETPGMSGWRENAAMAAVLLGGMVLRLFRWDQIPPGVHVDEAINGLNALGVLVREYTPVFFENSDGREALLPYLQAGSFQLFGLNLLSFRLPSLGFGLVSIVLAYALARELFGRQAGLAAAFLTAVSKWDLVVSRISHEAVPVPMLAIAAGLFFVRALRTRRWADYLACGAVLGIGTYTYPAFRTMPLAILASAAVLLISRRSFARQHLARLTAAAALSVALAAPMLVYIQGHWAAFTQRMKVTSFNMDPRYDGNAFGALWNNTLASLRLLFADNMAVYYLPGDAVLDRITAILAVVGLTLCLGWRASGRSLLLPLWLGLGLVPSILSHANRLPHALRSATLITLMPVAAGAGLIWLLRWLPDRRPVRAAVVVAVLIAVAVANVGTYFGAYADSAHVYGAFDPVPSAAGRAAALLSEQYDVFVSPLLVEHSSFRLVSYGSRYRRLDEVNLVGIQGEMDRDVLCIISPFDVERYQDRLSRLKRDFPGGVVTEHLTPYGGLLYSTYLVRRADIPVVASADVAKDWAGKAGALPILYTAPGQDGLLGWFYQDTGEGAMWMGSPRLVRVDAVPGPGDWATANFPFSVIWRGELDIPAEGDYALGVEALGRGWLLVDGQMVATVDSRRAAGEGRGNVRLAAGRHAIEARYAFYSGRPRFSLFWLPPGGAREVIPASQLHAVPRGVPRYSDQFPRWKWPAVPAL